MENNNYKSDKLAIIEQQQSLALEKFSSIELACQLSPVSFLKNNFANPKIRDRKTEPNFKFMLAVLWSKVCTLGGLKNEVDPFMVEDVNRMILSMYSDLTLEEIYKAFELERHGAYSEKTDHFQLFSAEYVSTIIKKYKSWRQTTKIQHNITSGETIEKPTITPEEQKQIMDNGICRLYEEFLVSGEISIPCVHIFDELYARKLFPEDTDYPRKFSIAKFQLEKELKSEKSSNRQDRNKIQEALNSLNSSNNEKVLARAKQLVLKDYFTYLKSINQSIKELL